MPTQRARWAEFATVLGALGAAGSDDLRAQVARDVADEFTRYELLEPGSGRFKISYDVTVTTPGARVFFNPIRRGSEASDESVIDPATGRPIGFRVVSGWDARREGFGSADTAGRYIRVPLPRPVPGSGEVRLRIIKTYRDPDSYRVDGDLVIFERTLSIRRNAVVLPAGFELVGVNYPSQVLTHPDGRTSISFWSEGPAPVPLSVKGRRL
ncbi:MAG: hypothetical protein FJ206_09575 [Gemmatimonadetes bacterium]|nr:hypothetical protein [Gemmatimonadota bacterium]